VTNEAILAVLALPGIPGRQLRFLLALGTFARGEHGWRKAGIRLLASKAGLSPTTAAKARGELVKAGVIEFARGRGHGLSTYRIRLPGIADYLDADTTNAGTQPSTKNAGTRAEQLAYQPAPRSVPTGPDLSTSPNAPASGNANEGSSTYGSKSSGPPRGQAARDPRTLLDGLGADERLTEHTLGWMEDQGIGDPFGYLLAIIGKHPDAEDGIRQFLDRRRRELTDADDDDDPRPPPKPPWCGECDERTRQVGLPDSPARCIRCHPLSVQPPAEPAPTGWLKPWCGQCDHPDTRWAEAGQPDGTVQLVRCPDCGIRR
jgi:hypothetical protein